MIRRLFFSFLVLISKLNIFKFNLNKKESITVVCFHRISNEKDYSYPAMPLTIFHLLIKYFSKNYSIILPSDVLKKTSQSKLILTFDDGYKDFIDFALPILVHYKVPAVMNVVVNSMLTGELFWTQKLSYVINHNIKLKKNLVVRSIKGDKEFMLDKNTAEKSALIIYQELKNLSQEQRNEIINAWVSGIEIPPNFLMSIEDMKTCIKNGIIIGSHSYSHEALTEKTEKEILIKEIESSKLMLEDILKLKVDIFASPNGEVNSNILAAASNSGYKYFFTTEENVYSPNQNQEMQLVPRILLYDKSVNENIMRTKLFHLHAKKIIQSIRVKKIKK